MERHLTGAKRPVLTGLTVDGNVRTDGEGCLLPASEREAYFRSVWACYRRHAANGGKRIVWVIEEQRDGTPQAHILVDRYWSWMLAGMAATSCGGGPQTGSVKDIESPHQAACYLAKDFTKSRGLKGRRYGSSRDIDLDLTSDLAALQAYRGDWPPAWVNRSEVQ